MRKSDLKYILVIAPTLLIILILIDVIFPVPPLKPYSKEIFASDGTLLAAYLSSDDKWRMRTNLDDVTPDLVHAIVAKEDKWFYWHTGINPIAAFRAAISNFRAGRRVSGASTITMQVARMLAPAERSYFSKIKEAFRAVQLEMHYSKREILEIYLSMLPYGGNIEGVESASYIYFERPPSKLSLSQAITLAVVPNNPNKYRLDKNPNSATGIRNSWIRKFMRKRIFNRIALNDALNEPLNASRHEIDQQAPHFCRFVRSKYSGDILRTTLNVKYQKIAEKLLANYISRVKIKGVTNGAVLVVKNSNTSVAAYCGSADFADSSSMGQVNGITAIRSPGSTLKPALFAMAFDEGNLTPKMKMLDIPVDYAGFSPENYTLQYNGDVTVEFALRNSLNIPAVRLLENTGLDNFIQLLEKAGFSEISRQRQKLGLSMILGGCGASLDQITRLFSSFAKEGRLYEISFLTKDTSNKKSLRLFNDGSCYMISKILSGNERPDLPLRYLSTTRQPRIAWKTGTSYGKRDAWAIGFNPNYTIGVWMGNFNGTGSPHLSGVEMAVPLLFDLFNAIDYNNSKTWFARPDNVLEREVCAETGLLPGDNCSDLTTDLYLKSISHNRQCDLYKEIYVSDDESIQYCADCLPEGGYKKAWFPFYDQELTLWYTQNNISFRKAPPHNPLCITRFTNQGPKIISPSANYEYLLENNSNEKLMLQAASQSEVKTHYWYINNKLYAESKPGDKIFVRLPQGLQQITCLDDKGRKSSISVKVKYY